MIDSEKLFLNFLLLIAASGYWFTTGHLLPAILGYIILVLYFVDETFSLLSLFLLVLTLLIIIYFFFIDYLLEDEGSNFAQFGFSIIYMFTIFFKSKSIFNAE